MKREKFCKESLFPASGTRIESFVSWQTYFPFSLSPTLTKILFSPEKSVQTSDSCKFSHIVVIHSRATSERERFSKSFQYLSNYYSKRIIYPIISIVSRRCVYRRTRRRFSKCSEAFYTRSPIFPVVQSSLCRRCINITVSLYTSVRG